MVNTKLGEKHVAVLAFPFSSHSGLLLGLLRRLAKVAPNVTFSFFNSDKFNVSFFSGKTLANEKIKPFDVPDGLPDGAVGKCEADINLFLKVAEENFKKALKEAEKVIGMKISCIMADAMLWFSAEMAEEISVPWIPVWTSGANSISIHVYTELIRQTLGTEGIAGREDEILTFVPGFSELRLGDLPSGVVFGNLESPFAVILHKMGQMLDRAEAIPMNSFEELNPPIVEDLKSKFKNVLNVGPFNLTSPPPIADNPDKYGCIPWLDKHEKQTVAYIGFGTVASPPPHELKALAEALEATKIPFIWSLKDHMKSHLPEGFLERTSNGIGKIVPWAPQVQILKHESVGVFLNHCGWNSVMESIAAGVPIICRPIFGDHQVNTWMVEKVWKIGMRVEGGSFTKEATIKALELVLKQEEGKKLKDQIVSYEKLALEAVDSNGSSTRNFETLVQIITTPKA